MSLSELYIHLYKLLSTDETFDQQFAFRNQNPVARKSPFKRPTKLEYAKELARATVYGLYAAKLTAGPLVKLTAQNFHEYLPYHARINHLVKGLIDAVVASKDLSELRSTIRQVFDEVNKISAFNDYYGY